MKRAYYCNISHTLDFLGVVSTLFVTPGSLDVSVPGKKPNKQKSVKVK